MTEQLFGKTSIRVIQLFVVFLILIFLLVLVFAPTTGKYPAHKAQILRSSTQVRSLALGTVVFARNNKDLFPTAEEWPVALIESGAIELEDLVSRVEDGDGVSFIYLPSHNKLFEDGSENRIMIYEDPKHFKDGVVVGFADAHVEIIKHEVFEQMLADQLAAQTTAP